MSVVDVVGAWEGCLIDDDVAVDAGLLRIHSLQAHQFHAYQVRMAYPGRAD